MISVPEEERLEGLARIIGLAIAGGMVVWLLGRMGFGAGPPPGPAPPSPVSAKIDGIDLERVI